MLAAASAKQNPHSDFFHDSSVWTGRRFCVNLREGSADTIPPMSGIKLVVFDIAGTIIEDHGEVVRAFAKALMENGIPFAEDELKKWKGASKREVIRHFVKQSKLSGDIEPRVETCYQRFRSQLESCYSEKVVPIAGAVETFRWCRDHDILLATTTGF